MSLSRARRRQRAVIGAVVAAAWVAPAGADPTPREPTPHEPTAAAIRIWYHGSEGCPDGARFVARLAELGRQALLADVGDRVDFVVSLAARPDASAGRLERQTERGTVAIRQLTAPACTDVAEALALSLELALAPAGGDSSAPPASPADASEPTLARPPSATPVDVASDSRPPRNTEANAAAGAWGVGARATLLSGLAPSLLPGAALFVELGAVRAATARLGVGAAYREAPAGGAELALALWWARLDACAAGFGGSALLAQPCLALDAGLLRAESDAPTARSDRGAWGSASALLRGRLRVSEALWPEAELGLSLPFVRYTFGGAETGDLYRSEALLVQLSLGARWSP